MSDHIYEGVEWTACEPPTDNPEGLPYPTHAGVLDLCGIKLRCVQLNTGQRLIDAEDVGKFLGFFGPTGGMSEG